MTHDNHATTPVGLIEQYRRSFAKHGDTPAAVLWPRGRQTLRFDALTRHLPGREFSVLDYGCGLAHLKAYLDGRCDDYEYRGADVVPEFVHAVSAKYPDAHVNLIETCTDVTTPVDHVVISGTFNIIEGSDRAAYVSKVKTSLVHLFSLARVSLAVNFMTDRVDFMQPNALHINVSDLMGFARQHLSPRLMVDESYMPYEFTLVVFKDSEIARPDNIYRPL